MSVTHSTAVRSVLADALDNYLNTTGSAEAGAQLILRDSTTDVVVFQLGNPAFGAAASGVITGSGLPIEAQADADGDVDNFRIVDRDGVAVVSGSVTSIGMGGDVEVSNTNIADNQDCSLDQLTYTAAA